MPDTDAQVSAGPSGSNNGPGENIELQTVNPRPARSDNLGPDTEPSGGSGVLDGKAAREAAWAAVVEKLQKYRTKALQSDEEVRKAIKNIDETLIDESRRGLLFTDKKLLAKAKEILVSRREAEKEYRDKLRAKFRALHGDLWTTKISPPDSDNKKYEQWLGAEDPLGTLADVNANKWSLVAPLSGKVINASDTGSSIYKIDFARAKDCAAVVVSNMSLRVMCELGNHLKIEPEFFIDYTCSKSTHKYRGPLHENRDNGDQPEGSAECHLIGRAVESPQSNTKLDLDIVNLVFNTVPSRDVDSMKEPIDPEHESRLSCLRIRHSLFVIALKVGTTTTSVASDVAPTAAIVLPCSRESPRKGQKLQSITSLVHNEVVSMYSDAQRIRRLSEHLQISYEDFAGVLLWQLAIWMYNRQLQKATLNLQELSFESVTISPSEALNRVKNGRARVARLRKTLASTKEGVLKHGLERVYREAAEHHPQDDLSGNNRGKNSLLHEPKDTDVALSVVDEYASLDQQAAELMPPLNESLQLVIATISLEQSNAALEDMEVSRRNGERATLLTLLAAIYLPLSLVTGIFGMNIQEISGETKGPKWRLVVVVGLSLLGVSGILITIFWFWPKIKRRRSDLQHQIEAQDDGKEQKERGWFWQKNGDRKSPSGGEDGANGKGWSWSDLRVALMNLSKKDKNS